MTLMGSAKMMSSATAGRAIVCGQKMAGQEAMRGSWRCNTYIPAVPAGMCMRACLCAPSHTAAPATMAPMSGESTPMRSENRVCEKM